MGYAIRHDGNGWRVIDGASCLLDGEYYSDAVPFFRSENRRAGEIKLQLSQIDIDTVRPMRAVIAGTATQSDREKLSALENEASTLRSELSLLLNK